MRRHAWVRNPIASVLPANKPTTRSVERIDPELDNRLFDLTSPSDKEDARQDKCRFAEKQATARRRSNAATGFRLFVGGERYCAMPQTSFRA